MLTQRADHCVSYDDDSDKKCQFVTACVYEFVPGS